MSPKKKDEIDWLLMSALRWIMVMILLCITALLYPDLGREVAQRLPDIILGK